MQSPETLKYGEFAKCLIVMKGMTSLSKKSSSLFNSSGVLQAAAKSLQSLFASFVSQIFKVQPNLQND